MLLRAHGHHVHAFVGDQRADVAEQPDAVPGLDVHGDWIEFARPAPFDFDEARSLVFVEYVEAVASVHGDASATRDVPNDLIARHRPAAARNLRQQIAGAEHLDLGRCACVGE